MVHFTLSGGERHFQLGEWKDKCSKVHSAKVISAFETPPALDLGLICFWWVVCALVAGDHV